ncbi:MAG: TMEM175 family protein [Candidatus Chryseobacterium colombiense]|nr:TMEM175 family protein [Chryseobacterium sp.]WEK70418.1 MAG: TMEM175 family protein [Chryseobacterium sp.]
MDKYSEYNKDKEKFQLERIALFSDAVFAIAITLLIIEIKIPEIHHDTISDKELWNVIIQMLPKFIGFFISFFVIGLYWLAHHRIFNYVTGINNKLLWGNLLFLLPIVIMPFSTAFLSEFYDPSLKLPLAVYTVTICMAGFLNFRLWWMIGNVKNNLSQHLDKAHLRYNMVRSLTIPVIFLCAFLLSFVNARIAYFIPLTTPFLIFILRKYYEKSLRG